jgi:hypothetical protein
MKKVAFIGLLAFITMLFATGAVCAAEQITVQGQVTEENQLMDEEGNLYDIAETENGMEVMDMVGEKIQVIGTVTEDEGVKEITVESYNVLQ